MSWGANNCTTSCEIVFIVWNLKVHNLIHNSLSLISILSQINPAHIPPSCLCKVHFNVILPSVPVFFKRFLLLEFSYQNFVELYFCSQATCFTHKTLFDLITVVVFSEGQKSLSSSLSDFLKPLYVLIYSYQHFVLKHPQTNTVACLVGQVYR